MSNLKTIDFDYELPKELIAQSPLKDRSSSRLLMLDRHNGHLKDEIFYNITQYLKPGDCLVLNQTKVIPARLYAVKEDTKASAEILLLKRLNDTDFECLVKPGKKLRKGARLDFSGIAKAEIIDVLEDGNRIIHLEYEGILEEVLDKIGTMPLPPYITEKLNDKSRYQTVYASISGSAAAPTAGLHFTNELLDEISAMGVTVAKLDLKVGLGTFRPVKVDNIDEHIMHSEEYSITKETAGIINKCKENGGRIISVGTTSLRSLESNADKYGRLSEFKGDTDIFIYPGYKFKVIDALITNFHLPKSTLMMLVSALAGRDNIMRAYSYAIENKYRFFSFGDAMFIY